MINHITYLIHLYSSSGNNIQTIFVDDALPESSSIRASLFGKAGSVAESGVSALFLTVLRAAKHLGSLFGMRRVGPCCALQRVVEE